MKGIRKRIEDEDSKDYRNEKDFFSDSINEFLEKKISSPLISEEVEIQANNEKNDLKMALLLQQEEEDKSSNRKVLRRRVSGTNRKYQEGLIIKPSKRKSEDKTLTGNIKPKTGRVLNKPLLLSQEMAAVFSNQFLELSRPEVVKKLWEYIKANNLQDPKDKRFILCDDKLMTVFSRSRVNCFKMAKFLSPHLHRKEDLSNATLGRISKDEEKKISQPKSSMSTSSSPKKQKISNATIDDSDEEANEFLQENQMNPLLLNIPGVNSDMSYSAVQSAVLAYTQFMKLRYAKDCDLIVINPGSPIAQLVNMNVRGKVHILDIIERVRFLFDHKDGK